MREDGGVPTPYDRSTEPWPTVPAAGVTTRPPLRRARSGRMIAGVCRGVAEHVGISVSATRWIAVALAVFGGASVPAYCFLWALMPKTSVADDQAAAADDQERDDERSRWGTVVIVGAVVVAAGAAVWGSFTTGSGLAGSVLLPGLAIAVGAMIAWSNLDDAQRSAWLGARRGRLPYVGLRVALGVGLAVVGILVLLTHGQSLSTTWDSFLAAVGVLFGVGIIGAPWAVRFWGDLKREQQAAARASERADIAAHLHDSVLQTLALIQRQSGDPAAVTRLARAQERELRSWLYAVPSGEGSTLGPAVTSAAHEVEDLHGIPIDLVVTGDRPLEPHGQALVAAFREALLNAVRHGRAPVTAYVEIGADGVEAFVRDRGAGFDVEDVPSDRLGVRRSIMERMERHGGSARVRRRDDGTEVELHLPPVISEGATL